MTSGPTRRNGKSASASPPLWRWCCRSGNGSVGGFTGLPARIRRVNCGPALAESAIRKLKQGWEQTLDWRSNRSGMFHVCRYVHEALKFQ
jgi:hypothetical protein